MSVFSIFLACAPMILKMVWLNNVCVFCGVSQADSGFFCEGYSSDEDDIVKEEFRGNIIKQGCLLKQVRVERKEIGKRGNFD